MQDCIKLNYFDVTFGLIVSSNSDLRYATPIFGTKDELNPNLKSVCPDLPQITRYQNCCVNCPPTGMNAEDQRRLE